LRHCTLRSAIASPCSICTCPVRLGVSTARRRGRSVITLPGC